MKTNIVCVDDSSDSGALKLWTWTETCDVCGKIIFAKEKRYCSYSPDTERQDICLDCMREKFKIKENE